MLRKYAYLTERQPYLKYGLSRLDFLDDRFFSSSLHFETLNVHIQIYHHYTVLATQGFKLQLSIGKIASSQK